MQPRSSLFPRGGVGGLLLDIAKEEYNMLLMDSYHIPFDLIWIKRNCHPLFYTLCKTSKIQNMLQEEYIYICDTLKTGQYTLTS